MEKNIKTLSIMLGIAIFLLSIAFATITRSFAFSNKDDIRKFDIQVTNIDSTGINMNDIRAINTNILFNIHLSHINSINSFIMKVTNKGNIDAKVKTIEILYNDNYLFEYNNKKYYLNDFTIFTVNYANNNAENNIIVDSKVSENDNLLSNTNNKIMVSIRLKKDTELTLEEKEALDYYLNVNTIDKSISLNIDYQEK